MINKSVEFRHRLGLVWFAQSVTLHTNLGDIKCEIFCDEVPKSAEVTCFVFEN